MIPKTLYLYWGGKPLSWLRYLTIVSFKVHNPDWEVVVYIPAEPTTNVSWNTNEQKTPYSGEDYTTSLADIAEVRRFDCKLIDFPNDIPEVYKSDLFRLWVIKEYGGMYCDFDILFTKPMPDISDKKRLYCFHPDGHYAIGLLAGCKGDEVFTRLLEKAKSIESIGRYQSYGTTLWSRVLDGAEPEGWNIPKNLVYTYGWQHADKLFTGQQELPPDAIGVHWYGGTDISASWENKLKPDTFINHRSTITNIIRGL